MNQLTHHLKWFYNYTLYIGIALRKRIRKKGTDNLEVLEMNSQFWFALLNGYLITTTILPTLMTEQEFIATTRNQLYIAFAVPFFIKFGIDYYFFYWDKDWINIVHEFENNISKKTKKIYFVVFIGLLIFSYFYMTVKWPW